ncbi:MAG: hypothetical protein OSJ56_09665 [Prevotella sp.]|nr:hypothetical protein [Prevotella sp.]
MKDYTNSNPSFSDTIKIPEVTDTNHADNINMPTKQLLANDICLKDAIGREVLQKVLAAGQASITFNAEEIKENSIINIYASVPGVEYTEITVSGNDITVTFEAQEEDIYVKAVVSDALV